MATEHPSDTAAARGGPAPSRVPGLSIIIPVMNEATTIGACLHRLVPLRTRGAQVVVVDGGSTDDTVTLARPLCDVVVRAPRGRASQMNAGARLACGTILLFLHADTALPASADLLIRAALQDAPAQAWGRFDVRIDGAAPLLRVVARMMSIRSRLTGIATGDQAIFCLRDTFVTERGFPMIPIMEDIAFSQRLRRHARPICLRACVTTSGRRWEAHGVIRTILLMWWLRLAYALGAAPDTLAGWYRSESGRSSPTRIDQHRKP
ncbi:TIGR04283 family arsenosugar biosynthesis glycosyltransferase [Burkholderia glumae]|uniref:TIGR04283 family arsenosugar biosynthesis glycosyltransferase n=1 Tax=Burkholderia glumae TaxID=337 RepID=UPI0005D7804A|nr:TIGR04283 family arsenosugar biosynthesis glycosyltransferase [Burkholderia glumae]AJY62299.1 glycosyltransferase like 2 family protein [Burkholderia glumae LMG 2196 = ATCC 33617]QTP37278.1 PGL/p-HBAD biosynthesis glycosyltransferase [Burkholderia glumae]